jgi:hypothetical protein
VTEAGRAGNADYRKPNLFRLTYKHTNRSGPTHEWKKIAADDVAIIARRARGAPPRNQNSSAGKRQNSAAETIIENPNSIVRKASLLPMVRKPSLPSISRVGGRKSGGHRSQIAANERVTSVHLK